MGVKFYPSTQYIVASRPKIEQAAPQSKKRKGKK